jgi:hypothetical protein
MVLIVEMVGIVVPVGLIVIALWPGPWTIEIRGERGDEDRISAIKEAIEVLQRELDYLEAPEQEARIERLASSLSELAERGAAMPPVQLVPSAKS